MNARIVRAIYEGRFGSMAFEEVCAQNHRHKIPAGTVAVVFGNTVVCVACSDEVRKLTQRQRLEDIQERHGELTDAAHDACLMVWDWDKLLNRNAVDPCEWISEFKPVVKYESGKRAWERAKKDLWKFFEGHFVLEDGVRPEVRSVRILPSAIKKAREWLELRPVELDPPLSIGGVYQKDGQDRYYLAFAPDLLVTFVAGELVETEPRGVLQRMHPSTFTIELCDQWGITLEELDAVTEIYLYPSPHVLEEWRGTRG